MVRSDRANASVRTLRSGSFSKGSISGRTVLSPDSDRIMIAFLPDLRPTGCLNRTPEITGVCSPLPLHFEQGLRAYRISSGSDAERLVCKYRSAVERSQGRMRKPCSTSTRWLGNAFLQAGDRNCRRATATATNHPLTSRERDPTDLTARGICKVVAKISTINPAQTVAEAPDHCVE